MAHTSFPQISPTIFASTPRLWNEIYNNYLCDVKHLEEAQKKDVQDQGLTAEEQESIEEKKLEIRKKYSAVLGTRIKQVAVGGAPTSSDVFEFLVSTLTGVMISNTYGTTEVGGLVFHLFLLPSSTHGSKCAEYCTMEG